MSTLLTLLAFDAFLLVVLLLAWADMLKPILWVLWVVWVLGWFFAAWAVLPDHILFALRMGLSGAALLLPIVYTLYTARRRRNRRLGMV